jgi:hypothetical protein
MKILKSFPVKNDSRGIAVPAKIDSKIATSIITTSKTSA